MSTERADVARPGGRGPGRALRQWLWEPRMLVALALGSATLGAAVVATAAARGASEAPRAPGPNTAAPEAPESAREAARDVRTLAVALASPHHRTARALGPHRLRDRSALRLRRGRDELAALTVDTDIAMAGPDELRARTESSAGYARDLVVTGGAVYTRPGYGLFYRRPPEYAGEARDLADELASAPAAYLAPVLRGAAIASRREDMLDGRPALAIELSTGEAGASLDAGDWEAERAEVRRVHGELWLDAETGALLAADVRGDLEVTRGGRRLELTIELSRETEAIGAPQTIEAPSDEDVTALGEGAPTGAGREPRAGEEPEWNEP